MITTFTKIHFRVIDTLITILYIYLYLFIENHKRNFFIYFYFCFFYLCIAYKGNKMFFTQNLSFKQFCPRKNPISITEIFLYYLGRNNRGLEDLIKQKGKYPDEAFFFSFMKREKFRELILFTNYCLLSFIK